MSTGPGPRAALLLTQLAAGLVAAAEAPPPDPTPTPADTSSEPGTIDVIGHADRVAADQRHLDRGAVETFPIRSADELLRAAPGIHLSAHGGPGKAYQYFVRGFDAVHGADLSVTLEGIPLNEPSNVHGHGYLDLFFLPTDLITGVDLAKGASDPAHGDFATAATATYHLGLSRTGAQVRLGLGSDLTGRATAAYRPPGASAGTFVSVEIEGGRGVGEGRAYDQARGSAGWESLLGPVEVRVFTLGYQGRFESPGVLREEDIDAGVEGFWGAYPEAGGGQSRRVLGGASAVWVTNDAALMGLVWGGWRGLTLEHNFTGYAVNGADSDGQRQTHVDASAGFRLEARRVVEVGGLGQRLELGLDGRRHDITQDIWGIHPDGEVWIHRADADVLHRDGGAWVRLQLGLPAMVTLEPALRVDRLVIGLQQRIGPDGEIVGAPSWATGTALAVSPKLVGRIGPLDPWGVHGGWTRGFRSPEAGGVEDGAILPVMEVDTSELGAWVLPGRRWDLGATAFHIAVTDEILLDHTAGRFLSSGSTRRVGGELTASFAPAPSIRIDAETTFSDGRYRATGEAIPYAPRWLSAVGVYKAPGPDYALAGWTWSAGARLWLLGRRPLPAGFTSHRAAVLDLTARADRGRWFLEAQVDNTLASKWRDGEFVYASWFDLSSPRSDLPVLHITAGKPFAARVAVGARFGG